MAKDKVMIALALPSMIKNAVKTVKEVAHGVPFDISIGAKAGSGSSCGISSWVYNRLVIFWVILSRCFFPYSIQ